MRVCKRVDNSESPCRVIEIGNCGERFASGDLAKLACFSDKPGHFWFLGLNVLICRLNWRIDGKDDDSIVLYDCLWTIFTDFNDLLSNETVEFIGDKSIMPRWNSFRPVRYEVQCVFLSIFRARSWPFDYLSVFLWLACNHVYSFMEACCQQHEFPLERKAVVKCTSPCVYCMLYFGFLVSKRRKKRQNEQNWVKIGYLTKLFMVAFSLSKLYLALRTLLARWWIVA